MSEATTWILVIALISLGQGVFQVLLIISGIKSRIYSFLLLAALLVFLSISILEYSLVWSGLIHHFPHILGYTFVFQFLFGPLIYMLFDFELKNKKPFKSVVLHFVPFLIMVFVQFPFWRSSSAFKISFYQNQLATFSFYATPINLIVTLCFIIQTGLYGILIWRLGKIQAKGLRKIQILFYAYLFTSLVYLLLLPIGASWVSYACLYIVFLSSTFIYTISYLSFSNRLIFNSARKKYTYSNLSYDKALEIANDLKTIMKGELLFKNADLKLSDVSEKLSTSNHHLSQAVNQVLNTSFSEYLNELRINYALSQIKGSSKKISLKEVFFDSGFNNKTTFANAFKKRTGTTPSEYTKQYFGQKSGKEL